MKEAKPEDAIEKLELALSADYRHQEALYALKCLNWWLEKVRNLENVGDPRSGGDSRGGGDPRGGGDSRGGSVSCGRGDVLLSYWKSYFAFLDRIGYAFDGCQYALKRFVYSYALQNYTEARTEDVYYDPGLLERIGRCYKGLGSYAEALKYLKDAAQFKQEDADALSVLADVYALLGETKAAKALFREAFFIDPQKVDLYLLESSLIVTLIKRVEDMGYSGAELREWLPVYGALFGVFSVKRELKPAEAGKLKQQIFYLESELRGGQKDEKILTPSLINKYFRLIDHYEGTNNSQSFIDEIKVKIKIIKPDIFERYMS